MEKTYNLKKVEKKWDNIWSENHLFKTDNQPTVDPFSIILPPPGITESIHAGHPLTLAISDIIVRRKKMQGFNTLWFPGSNPAAPATWAIALERRMGLALQRNLMKPDSGTESSKVVTRIFVQLYKQGKIYRVISSKQWFLRTPGIANPTQRAVQSGEIIFIPEKYAAAYVNRMQHIRDWRLSRQLKKGHRIPAYYCHSCDHIMVVEDPPLKCAQCDSMDIEQDQDFLDTWFSAAFCPLSTLGWQDNANNLNFYYPTSLMVIGFDLLFSWLAFMIMVGLHFAKNTPSREILVNGTIRDESGKKMSKTKNNVIDPLEIIEKYGADPFRFTLAIQAVPGMDIFLSLNRINGYKAFANKIWNASRYILMHLEGDEDFNIDAVKLSITDRWILHALNNTIVRLNDFMDNYRLHDAANLLYHFFWHEYCDWYLEFSKNDIHKTDTRKTLKLTLFKLIQMLHPFMPFITEEIYEKIKENSKLFLLNTGFPAFDSDLVFNREFIDVEVLKKVIAETRKTRAENKINPNHRIPVYLRTDSPKERTALSKNMKCFNVLTGSVQTEIVPDFSGLSRGFKGACLNWEILLPFDNEEDRLKELAGLKKELKKIENQVNLLEKKLSNKKFVDKTHGAEVFNLKKNLQETIGRKNRIQKTIDDLS